MVTNSELVKLIHEALPDAIGITMDFTHRRESAQLLARALNNGIIVEERSKLEATLLAVKLLRQAHLEVKFDTDEDIELQKAVIETADHCLEMAFGPSIWHRLASLEKS